MYSEKAHFDLKTGLIKHSDTQSLKRYAHAMRGMFVDTEALEQLIAGDDPLIYEYYDLGVEEKRGNLAYGTSIVYPGRVGDEFFMTKGHYHSILDTAEVYLCLSGHGLMVMENPEGETEIQALTPGEAILVPGRFAHRTVNISETEALVTFFTFAADAGHDYATIEEMGFRKLILHAHDGLYRVVDNPNWEQKP